MKTRVTHRWRWFAVLALFALCSGALFAQDEPAGQAAVSELAPFLFQGTLSERDASEGNQTILRIAINAGDQITASALCEAAADGHRLIDPALTVRAPQADGAAQRQQWYNDDNDAAISCVDYRSSQLTFEAPVTGLYEFIIENLAMRGGPFSLEVLGSSASQTELDLAPPAGDEELLVESGAEGQPDAIAAIALADASSVRLTFTGVLTGSGAAPNNARIYKIKLNDEDAVSARLICDEYSDSRPFHPQLQVDFTDSESTSHQWVASAEAEGVDCDDERSSVAVSFTAPETGTYSFTVTNENSDHGAYTLSIGGITADQAPQSPALWDGSDPNVEGRWASAEFSGGEGSLIVLLQAGTRVASLAVCLLDEDGGRPANPQLRVLDPDGEVIATADESQDYQICDGGYSAYVEFTATVTGHYTFQVTISDSEDTTAQAAPPGGNNPSSLVVLHQLPEENDGNGNGNGNGNDGDGDGDGDGDDGGRACSGDDLIGKLGEIACVFSKSEGSGQNIDVYHIDSESRGHFVLRVQTSQLGDAPSSETEVGSGTRGPHTFRVYHKPNGDLRITGGPSSEGKTYELTIPLLTGSNNNNNNNNNNNPSPGGTATPQPQRTHVVQAGETLYSIATQYGVTVQAIANANGIGSDYIIHVGNTLVIPNP